MQISLFENFNSPKFREDLNRSNVSIYHAPIEYNGASAIGGKVLWSMEIMERKSGYELGSVTLNLISLVIETQDPETDEEGEVEIEISKQQLSWDRIEQEIKGFPLYLSEIEIDMRHTIEPEHWKYRVVIGSDPE